MAIFYDLETLPKFKNSVITIGTFDGIHLGHKAILNEVVTHAQKVSGESVLITFEPHPRKVIFPDQTIKLLTPLEEKLKLVTAIGIEHIVVVPFTKAFSQLSAKQYVTDFLVNRFHPDCIVIGYDHHFGNDRKGNISLLKEMQHEYGFEVYEISAQLIDEAAVSSTKVRNAIGGGDVSEAAEMLGRYYSIKGTVVEGQKLGRTIQFPTANINPLSSEQIVPAKGVYAVRVIVNGMQYGAMLNIGTKPTVTDADTVHIEAHLFDFDQDIYHREIEVQFVSYIRAEEKFNSIEQLKAQLFEDRKSALSILA